MANFAAIVAELSAPLGIGNLQLEDGSWRVYIQSLNHTNTQFKGEKIGGVSV
ncbi:hypothetical protein J2769_002166 [Acinetobacter guillouiae]|nr:hypothetical protein [Acinetobacter guillouiae]